MAEEVKVYGFEISPFSGRALIALKLKGIEYEYIEEDLANKSADLLRYNPVYKKIPVLLHNGKPLAESIIIVEYIDETWNIGSNYSILPESPYDKAVARFWAKFVDEKCIPAIFKAFASKDKDQIEETRELLKTLEKQLQGKKFFGGESIGVVDIAANVIGYWVETMQEATGMELVTKEKFPKLTEWMDDFCSLSDVKACLPPREKLVTFFRRWYN